MHAGANAVRNLLIREPLDVVGKAHPGGSCQLVVVVAPGIVFNALTSGATSSGSISL